MSTVLQKIRGRFLGLRRWEETRIDGETAFECRYCEKQHFGSDPPVRDLREFFNWN